MGFGIKIQSKKAEIVASEIVIGAGIAEADEELHEFIIAEGWFWGKNGDFGVWRWGAGV